MHFMLDLFFNFFGGGVECDPTSNESITAMPVQGRCPQVTAMPVQG